MGHPSQQRSPPCTDRKSRSTACLTRKLDLVGPGIGDLELEKILPDDYSSLLSAKETQKALFEVVREKEHSCAELAGGI